MTDHDVSEMLRTLGGKIPVRTAPPTRSVIEDGRRRLRRLQVLGVVGTAVALSLAVWAGTAVLPIGESSTSASSPREMAGPSSSEPTCAIPPPPSGGMSIQHRPAAARGATHFAVGATGEVAAWFSVDGALPTLTVYDLGVRQVLATEDLGVGDVAEQPSLRVGADAVYYRTGADADVWMRYRWTKDDYPSVYVVDNGQCS